MTVLMGLPDLASAQWQYSSNTDKMTGEKRIVAALTSRDSFRVQQGPTRLQLFIRETRPAGSPLYTVYISTQRGVLNCSSRCRVQLKFDDEDPFSVDGTESSDHSYDTLFLGDEAELVAKLTTTRRLLIRVEYFGVGQHVFEFAPTGLKLPKP